jgi:hypothetical protein
VRKSKSAKNEGKNTATFTPKKPEDKNLMKFIIDDKMKK